MAGIEVSEAGVQFAQTELGLDVKQQAAEKKLLTRLFW